MSESKRAADAQAHLAAIVESSDDAILTKSLEGIITTWNSGAERMFLYTAEEIIGKSVTILIPPDHLDEEPAILSRLRKGERIDHYETVRVRKDGTRLHIALTVSPMKNSKGEIIGASKIARNITARIRAQEALRDETRVLELLNSTGTAIAAQLDLQTAVQTVTDAATQLSGAKFGAFFYNVINRDGEALVLFTLSGAPREAFEKFGNPRATALFGPTFRGEGPIRSDDILKDPRYGKMPPHHGMPKGHLPVRSYLAVPVISRTGEVIGGLFFGHPETGIFTERTERIIVGVAAQAAIAIDNARLYESAQNEIAERKRAELALARRVRLTAVRAEISTMLASGESIPVVLQRCADLLVKHLDAVLARVWTLNEGANEFELKASAGLYTQLDGRHYRIKLGESNIGRIAQSGTAYVTNDVPHDATIDDPDWAKREGLAAFAGYPLVVEERVLGVIALFAREPFPKEAENELSLLSDALAQWLKRKETETALHEARDELEAHADALEKQVAQRTANLRETIQSLEGVCYTLAHDLRAPLRAVQGFTKIILEDYGPAFDQEGREVAARIVNSAARMDLLIRDLLDFARLSHAELPSSEVDLNQVVANVITNLKQEASSRNSRFEAELLPSVWGNKTLLEQIFTNLFSNSLKFVAPGVEPKIKIWAEQKPDGPRIFVQDNGIGIQTRYHNRVFGIFQRLHNDEKDYPGTGVGLAIVKKGVERLNGKVGILPDVSNGTCFYLDLQGTNNSPPI